MTAWNNRLKVQERKYYDVAHTKSAEIALKVFAHVAIFTKNPSILTIGLDKSWPHRAIR